MSYITRNPKRSIGALATVLAAAGVAVGSGATFSSQSAAGAVSAASGTLTQSNSNEKAAILEVSNLKPGDTRSGELTVDNTGSLSGKFTLKGVGATSTFEDDALTLKIAEKGSSTAIYEGDLEKVPAAGVSLGEYARESSKTYVFTVTLNQGAGNGNQGKQASSTYQIDAVQS